MFKKNGLILASIILFVITSCSNPQSSASLFLIDETLRDQIHLDQNEIQWTDEIDSEILKSEEDKEEEEQTSFKTGNPEFDALLKQAEIMRAEAEKLLNGKEDEVKQEKKIPKSSKKTDNLYLYTESIEESLFPVIIGFGSLDTRAIDDKISKILEDFLRALQKGKIDTRYISPKRSYISAVLEYQLLHYPAPVHWVFGKPHISEDGSLNSIEVPIRVWSKQAYYDMWIYISSNGTAEYIDQVQLGSIIVE